MNLGPDSPIDTIIQAARSTDELTAIVLSTVSSTSASVIVETVGAILGSLPEIPVMVGGVWAGLPDNVLSLDGFPSMLNHLEQLSGS